MKIVSYQRKRKTRVVLLRKMQLIKKTEILEWAVGRVSLMHNGWRVGWYVFLRKGVFKIVTGFPLISFDMEAPALSPRN